ncbi:MAG: sugar kinase [bacterium]
MQIKKKLKEKVEVISIGEATAEIFRKDVDQSLNEPADFIGPFASGAPAIFADTLAKLGCPSGFVGPIGADDFGKSILSKLNKDGVDTSQVTVLSDYTTGTAFTTYFSNGERKFLYHMRHAAPGRFSPQHVRRKYFSKAKFLHLTGNVLAMSESAWHACRKAVKIVAEVDGQISFDPNLRPDLMSLVKIRTLCDPFTRMANVLLPTAEEIQMLTGMEKIRDACRKILDERVKIIALKQGKKGSTVFTQTREVHVPAFEVEEVDPTGAGDCYDAGFIFGLLQGWRLEKTAKFANAVGALAVTKRGAMEGVVSLKSTIRFMEKQSRIHEK